MKIKFKLLQLLSLALFFSFSCQDKQIRNELAEYKQKDALEIKNIELAKKSIKYLDTSNYDSLRSICAEDFKVYINGSEPMQLDDFKPLHKMFYTAFPDYTHRIDNIIASGDYVVLQVFLSGTQKNEFQGIAPTNKKIKYKGIQILKIKEEKLEVVYAVDDDLTMLTQIGFKLE